MGSLEHGVLITCEKTLDIRGYRVESIEQSPDQNDRRVIAKRVFDALCEKYPDRYIALIVEPPMLAPELATGTPGAAITAATASASTPGSGN
jgi:hypothetical protein